MANRFWLAVGLAVSLGAAPALGQETTEGYNADDLTTILNRDAPAYTSDELSAILMPVVTRSLSPGAGVEPGSPGSGVVPNLNVNFEFDSATLTPKAVAQLDELGRALQSDVLRPFRFQISGHTDGVGADWYNESLSQRRARAVAAFLQERHGVETTRLEPIGMGERELMHPDQPAHDDNRRVEVKTLR